MSDPDPDYGEESDEEYSSSEEFYSDEEEDENEESIIRHSYHVEDARSTIVQHMDITNANALAINKKMQANLLLLKNQLEQMLQQCRQRYKDNEQTLLRNSQIKSEKPKNRREKSFYFFGYPFFKNLDLLSARPNADYLYRKKHLREFFPIEVDETPVFWVILDKVCLINGVREQFVDRLMCLFKDRKRNAAMDTLSIDSELLLTVGEYKKELLKKRLLDLMGMVPENDSFKIDWFSVSQTNLDDRHKPNTAEAIWNAYLKPSLNRKPWSADEEDQLLNAIEKCDPLDWSEVSKQITGRSLYQCLVHYRTKLAVSSRYNCGRWSAEEDALLLLMVDKYRVGNEIPWSNVVANIPKRSKRQVYQRYVATLKPGISRERFTVEEDCKIMAAFKEFGSDFQSYRHILPGRTTLQIRNRYNNVLSYVGKRANWTPDDDKILMEHVAEFGSSNWRAVSDRLKHHTRTSCRSRYTAISRHLKNNPDCDLSSLPRRRSKLSSDVTSDNWVEKIIEAKKASFKPTASQKALSRLNREYHNYFKYTHRYAFNSESTEPTPTTENTHAICRSLHCNVCPVDDRLLTALPTATIDLRYLDGPRETGETFLPVDQNTSRLLRGISIMFPDDLTDSERVEIQTPASGHPALELFRRRFATLLNNTAFWSAFNRNKRTDSDPFPQDIMNITVEIDSRLTADPAKTPKVYGGGKKRKTISVNFAGNETVTESQTLLTDPLQDCNMISPANITRIDLPDDPSAHANINITFQPDLCRYDSPKKLKSCTAKEIKIAAPKQFSSGSPKSDKSVLTNNTVAKVTVLPNETKVVAKKKIIKHTKSLQDDIIVSIKTETQPILPDISIVKMENIAKEIVLSSGPGPTNSTKNAKLVGTKKRPIGRSTQQSTFNTPESVIDLPTSDISIVKLEKTTPADIISPETSAHDSITVTKVIGVKKKTFGRQVNRPTLRNNIVPAKADLQQVPCSSIDLPADTGNMSDINVKIETIPPLGDPDKCLKVYGGKKRKNITNPTNTLNKTKKL